MSKGKLASLLIGSLVVLGLLWGVALAQGLRPRLGLDLQGGVSITLLPAPGQQVDTEILDETVGIIRQRIDALGVAEPDIARQGETVVVQLPGVTDQQRAEQVIGRTAQLQFRSVKEFIAPAAPNYAEVGPPCGELPEETPPADKEVVLCAASDFDAAGPDAATTPPDQRVKFRLSPVSVSGEQVADARAVLDPGGLSWVVELDFRRDGADAFAKVTGELACAPAGAPTRQLAIVLDGVVESSPPIAEDVACNQGIENGRAIIQTVEEAESKELALVLRTGALPLDLDFATSQSVSPTLGRSSLRAGLVAGAIGLALVALYLLVLYRGIGLAAIMELAMAGLVIAVSVLLLGRYVGFTLTLAGIAGIIVSIGITADSSIIYRERYRDELRAGRTVRTAADHAFTNAWRTNLTGNTVSLIAALVLYFLAVGPVRGFAFTLGLSTLIDTLLFATFTRGLFGLLARSPKLVASPLMGLRAAKAPAATGGPR